MLLLGLLLVVASGQGQTYEWPTEAGRKITATFGDIRPRRYHAGLDISTNGASGYAVYAVEDGFIERILVSTQGYGKAVYLRMKDKRLAVYAHLQKFTAPLERRILALQARQGQYALDLRFQRTDYPVRRGDVIGYTGDTGTISGPHLHFELRDPQNRPLNPLGNGVEMVDTELPEIASLAVIPLSPETVAHGSTLPSIISAQRLQPGQYIIPDTIAVAGLFGLAVEAYDRLPGVRYRPTLYGLSLSVDGLPLYSIQFDSYSFEEGKLVELERDYSQWRRKHADFHRLFTTQDTKILSFVRPGSKGTMKLAPGYHRFAVKVWDMDRNVAVLRGVLAYTPPTRLEASAVWSNDDNGWIVTLNSSTPLREYHAFFFDIRGRQVDQFSHHLQQSAVRTQRFLVPRQSGRQRIVQIIGVDRWGARLEPVHVSFIPTEDVTQRRRFSLLTEHLDHGVIFQISSDYYLPSAPEILLRTDAGIQRYPTRMVSPVDFLSPAFYLAQLIGIKEIIIRVNLSPAYEVRLPFSGQVAFPGSRGRLGDPRGHFILDYHTDALYDSTFLWISRPDVSPPNGAQLVMLPFEIGPFSRPFKGPLGIQMVVPSNRLLPEHAGIFYLDREEGWKYLEPAGSTDPENLIRTRTYRTVVTSGEIIALLEETEPPVIELKVPGHGATYSRKDLRRIRFDIRDPLAGIKDETAISLTLDGVPRIFEYSTFRETVTYVLPAPLEPGQHEMVINAIDQLGNSISKAVTFFIE